MILIELYRYKGGWRLSANGQGFVSGIGAVAHALGIEIPVPAGPDRPDHPDYGDRQRSGPSSGSGFAVDRRHIITNAHVVDGARSITVASEKTTMTAELVFSDPRNDIALVRVDRDLRMWRAFARRSTSIWARISSCSAFRCRGCWDRGRRQPAATSSSLSGIGNDISVLQFTAPIASGNSGGPILDMTGAVIGLVHASLNLERIRQGGNNAENVNFGVKAPIVRTFLSAMGIDADLSRETATRGRADIVRMARGYIYRIRCDG